MKHLFYLGLFSAFAVQPLAAKPERATNTMTPELFSALIKCRSVSGTAERLACFERATDDLESATERHDLVIIDRQQANETKRTLFGFNVGALSDVFGGKGEELQSIEGSVGSASVDRYGRWTITLVDGGHWRQIDDRMFGVEPKRGAKVVVNRGTLGSYVMRINGQPGIKVQRLN